MQPLDVLYAQPGQPTFELPEALAAGYGGTFGLPEDVVYANFVETLDGVVAIPAIPGSNKLVAGESEADRFVMGLLRASADVLMVGSGTMNASPRSVWTAEQAYPAAADSFAALRATLELPERAQVAVISASGSVDPAHPAFEAGAILLTTDEGAGTLKSRLPTDQIISLGATIEAKAIVAALQARGHRRILSEGGPHAIAPLLAARLVDELFLTISPLLAGRDGHDKRLALVEGADLLQPLPLTGELLSVRRDTSHLFLRYGS